MSAAELTGWERLRHGGLLLDPPRLRQVAAQPPPPRLPSFYQEELRRRLTSPPASSAEVSDFVAFVLQKVCRFSNDGDAWQRGSSVGGEWGRPTVTGEAAKPRHLWRGSRGAILPVFIDTDSRVGIGRGRKVVSQAIQWLRAGSERIALVTNGRQFRLVFAGLDFDAWCEWDTELWLDEGGLSSQVAALRTLLAPELWTPAATGEHAPLVAAILESRKGQADLSAVLGERVREAVELLVQAHGNVLQSSLADVSPSDIYRAAVRIVMRMVVVLFAESRESLLPTANPLYNSAYGLTGLLADLEKVAVRGGSRLGRSHNAWPRVLALFRLVYLGSHHPELAVPAYGGELFAPGDPAGTEGLSRALAVFERAAFDHELLPDRDVRHLLDKLTRTRVRVRQGRSATWVPAPVDFSDLSTEYIGILYEGLLDFELKTAPSGDPVVFLAVGNQPALPLSRLEAMDDKAVGGLLEKMKDTSKASDDAGGEDDDASPDEGDGEEDDDGLLQADDEAAGDVPVDAFDDDDEPEDPRRVTTTRAERWARRAVEVGKLVRKPSGTATPEKHARYQDEVGKKAQQLVVRVILPGEWYLVRWGGTRKGAGTFYTRPGLAVPTVHRTLRPLAYDAPIQENGEPNRDAPASEWTPKPPEDILALKVCDPACGSGTFPVAALRYLTDALYASLHHHRRFTDAGDRTVVQLLGGVAPTGEQAGAEPLGQELLPCRPDDAQFEPRLKAVLRRYVVERCIYGVDLDPLAVELCRLALWIETMDRQLPFSFLDHKVKCGNSLVGAWFDQFRHYPVMAWKNREAGDKNHTNGVHFQKEVRTKAIKAFVKDRLTPDLRQFLAGRTLFSEDLQQQASTVHDEALGVLARVHELPVHDNAERARLYRELVLGSPAYRLLKSAMDQWCACWFWPADDLPHAPLPSTLAGPAEETRAVAARIAEAKRFFHWELEFPDVFRAAGSGFDAILGNPPWDIAKPSSKEFFSNIDPLYRSYGKQEALRYQTEYFERDAVERGWLDYTADFKAQSNLMGYAAAPFGDPADGGSAADRFAVGGGQQSLLLHERWSDARKKSQGFADAVHPFHHQGSADINLYKAFLEQAHALLRSGGRLGFIVPSGLYSDQGTGDLRRLFLDRCRWEWLFGFINWRKIFPSVYYRFKFSIVVLQKGGNTSLTSTAFVRTELEDWEQAEALATPYSRAQVEQFSPRSKAILEIQSQRDLEILEKIYANSVLLGDDGPNGWGIKYATEFHMTNDSKLFPPRPWWEAQGYRPDEYSRWLKGDWRPISELWAELRIDPSRVVPVEVELEDGLFATPSAVVHGFSPAKGEPARRVHGYLLKPGDVQRTAWSLRCAQPPHDTLPIPRADIPSGIILSRDADAWVSENRVEDTALPLYEGRMVGQFDFSQKEWVSGAGRSARWDEIGWDHKVVQPQYLMAIATYQSEAIAQHLRGITKARGKVAAQAENARLSVKAEFNRWWHRRASRVAFMDVTSATNERTLIASRVLQVPSGNKVPLLRLDGERQESLCVVMNSFAFDFVMRRRLGGLSANWFIIEEAPLPPEGTAVLNDQHFLKWARSVASPDPAFSVSWFRGLGTCVPPWRADWRLATAERLRARCILDAIVARVFGLSNAEFAGIFAGCDEPAVPAGSDPNGFWRVDKDKDPELRHTVLTLVAFQDLERQIEEAGGDGEKGIEAFLSQNDGEGWMLPETLRLADYGLGHDERADAHQPVASRLGPRFLDWQLTQSAEESWRECHLHARNLLGEAGYRQVLPAHHARDASTDAIVASVDPDRSVTRNGKLFD